MDATTAPPLARPMEVPAWKTFVSHAGALITAFLFLIAGIYKAVDPYKFAALADNLFVYKWLTLPLALTLAVFETSAGLLVLIPRFRRWGAMLAGLLLLAFMGYIGWNYTALLGRDCSCFPKLTLPFGIVIDMTRSVGPEFFYGDAAFLAAAAAAGIWAKKSYGLRNAAVIMGAVAVFTGASFGVAFTSQTGIKAPDSITVEGQPMSLQSGRVVLFFFDPFCGTCFAVGEGMAKEKWKSDVTVIGLPTNTFEAGAGYIRDSKLQAKLSPDSAKLREIWKFDNPPYLVLLENGRQKGGIQRHEWDEEHLDKNIAQLRAMGVIE